MREAAKTHLPFTVMAGLDPATQPDTQHRL